MKRYTKKYLSSLTVSNLEGMIELQASWLDKAISNLCYYRIDEHTYKLNKLETELCERQEREGQ